MIFSSCAGLTRASRLGTQGLAFLIGIAPALGLTRVPHGSTPQVGNSRLVVTSPAMT
jgi:hypothetical protein